MTKWMMKVTTVTPHLNEEDSLSKIADTLFDGLETQFELVNHVLELAVVEVVKEACKWTPVNHLY
jgi:hypothetical protein